MSGIDNPATTVEELTKTGSDAVDAFCGRCGNLWRAPIMFLPAATTIAKVEALMACTACGGRDIEVSAAAWPAN